MIVSETNHSMNSRKLMLKRGLWHGIFYIRVNLLLSLLL